MTSETAEFLATLFGEKPETAWVLIWAKKGDRSKSVKISRWAQNVNEAIAAVSAADSEPGWDTYVEICTGPKKGGKSNRIEMADTVSMPCLWLDIDIAGVGHTTKKKYPASEAEARALIAMCPLAPSFIIHSGGGLQPYWVFKEHWTFDTSAERDKAQTLIRGWVRMYQMHAATKGLDIDPTFDLARVMRVPGTSNWKGDEPRLVRIVDRNDIRYDPGELHALIPPEAFSEQTAKGIITKEAVATANFILNPEGSPPADKLIALQLADVKFDATVKYQRTDLKDATASGYDLALCNFAAYAEWTEQEIADLLMFVRRTQRQNLKLDNVQYYVRTINEAMAAAQRRRAMEELRGNAAALRIVDRPASGGNPTAAAPVEHKTERAPRELTLQYLSEALGCRIRDVIKYAQDPPKYRLITEKGGIDLGDVTGLIEQSSIRKALAATNSHYIPKFKNDDWEAIAQMLLDVCRVISTGPESTDTGAMREWLNVYFDENPPGELNDVTIANQQPHVNNGFICFYGSHLRTWLYQRQNEKVTAKHLGILLRRIKGKPANVAYEAPDGKRSMRAVWQVPAGERLRRLFKPQANGNGKVVKA
jgi:hypothetical protein